MEKLLWGKGWDGKAHLYVGKFQGLRKDTPGLDALGVGACILLQISACLEVPVDVTSQWAWKYELQGDEEKCPLCDKLDKGVEIPSLPQFIRLCAARSAGRIEGIVVRKNTPRDFILKYEDGKIQSSEELRRGEPPHERLYEARDVPSMNILQMMT